MKKLLVAATFAALTITTPSTISAKANVRYSTGIVTGAKSITTTDGNVWRTKRKLHLHKGANVQVKFDTSLKNFPKANVTIPTDKMDEYKKIIAAIQKEDLLTFSRFTQSFLYDVLAKKLGRRNKPFDYKTDMKKLMMARQTKEYIYTKNMWDEYLKYLEEKIEKFYKEK